jgi:tRNA A-37 threonylcarbamoyl transferase component Bud32
MLSSRNVCLPLLALLGGLALTVPGVAQPPAKKPLLIMSYPPGASVTENGQFLGPTGSAVKLTDGAHDLTVHLEGHQRQTISVSTRHLAEGRYSEVVVLPPDSALVWFTDLWRYRRGQALGLVALLVASLAGLVKARSFFREHTKRKALVDQYVPKEGEVRSMIMGKIGSYRVLSPLGQGGMAEVYLAVPDHSLEMKDAVAIKVLNRDLRDRDDTRSRFEREIKVSSELVHPGIVEVYESGWNGERMYLAMELVEGDELRDALPKLSGDWPRIREILDELMTAVEYAHQRGVAHRDLKPENVRLTLNGKVKVMDFGLARSVDSATLTQAGTTMGTPRYIAPESVAGLGADDRADQYSLGVMAYEIITGRLPFESEEVLYLLYCHATVEPDPPSSKLPGLSPDVDRVVMRMLAKVPNDRYPTVAQARDELLQALRQPCC